MISVTAQQLRKLASWVNVNTDIWDVRVVHLHARASDPPLVEAEDLRVSGEAQSTARRVNGDIEVKCRYSIEARRYRRSEPDESSDDDLAWEVNVELAGLFDVAEHNDDPVEFSEAHLKAFAITTGAMAVHPYAREIVQSAVANMGYPGYTLGFMRTAWELADDETFELDAELEDLAGID